MHDAYIPLVFFRHNHRLRALEPHEQNTVTLAYTGDFHEQVQAISDAGDYRALFRFDRPEHRAIGRWLSDVLVPTLHDYHRDPDATPRRSFISWNRRQIGVMRWQGEVWLAWRDLPALMAGSQEAKL